MFELRHLRHALGLAEHRNFARAAEALHITQPALSRSIQALEDSLGVRLFDRDRTGVEATFFGRLLLNHARELEFAARDLQHDIELAKGLQSGELKIGVGPWGAAVLVGTVIGALNLLHPQLRVTVVIAPWKELPARLHAREIDLSVADISEVQADENLEVLPLLEHRALLVCRAGHPLAERPGAGAQDVFEFPLAAPNLPAGALERLLSHLPPAMRPAARKRGLISITCDSSSVLKTIIAQSNALTIMNVFMVLDELREGKLRALPDVDLGVRGQFGIARLRRRTPSPASQVFVDMLVAHDSAIQRDEDAFLRRATRKRGEGARKRPL